MYCHLSLNLSLQLLHLGYLGALPGVVERHLVQFLVSNLQVPGDEPGDGVGVVLPLLGSVAIRYGTQLRVAVEEVSNEDSDTSGDGSEHEVEVNIILELVVDPS